MGCCATWGVTHVVLPAKVARPSGWARLRGHTLADFQDSLPGVEILVIHPMGACNRHPPAGKPQPIRTAALV
jgi:hypothetical protein